MSITREFTSLNGNIKINNKSTNIFKKGGMKHHSEIENTKMENTTNPGMSFK